MAFSPADSAIKVNSTLEEKIFNAKTSVEVSELLRAASVEQGLAVSDRFDPTILLPVDRPAPGTPRSFAKSVTVDGEKHIFESATEEGANAKLLAFIRESANDPAERPRDSESGRFVAARTELDAVAAADLEIKLRTGQISTETYLAESGAIERHLENLGVSVESLKAASAQTYQQSWQQATETFLKTSDWPGGDENLKIASRLMSENGLQDKPSVETLLRVYAHMKEHNLLVENPVTAAHAKIGAANTVEEIREAAMASQGRSSSMFGHR